MTYKRRFHWFIFSLAIVVSGLLTGIALTAPVPKDRASAKASETEIAVTPSTDNKDQMVKDRRVSSNNLKEIALSVLNYESAYGDLPRDITDKNGKKLLSWRVLLLPYLEENELYKQFKLEEPWDSENNLKLVEKMPKTLASPRVSVNKPGFTVYQGFAGPGAFFDPEVKRLQIVSITDGTSNTILAAESSVAVPWTKPADLPFDPNKDLPNFGKAYGAKPLVAMCDGSVRIVDTKNVSATTLKAAITIAGGEVLGADW